jgi:hypothetical protein
VLKRVIGRIFICVFLIAIGFLSGWEFSRAFYEKSLPAPQKVRQISKILMEKKLSSLSPMDEPPWYKELLRNNTSEKPLQKMDKQESFVRGYW